VAREAIRARLEDREAGREVRPEGALSQRAPVFVTLKIDGELRGCIGDVEARHKNLVEETMDRAVAAALLDPRFPPLTLEELEQVTIDVTVLEPLEAVEAVAELDPEHFGIELSDAAGRRAVLLPAIPGVDSVEQQLAIARRKAGIPDDAQILIRRFRALKISES
jgi:AmmeMemoRadiSam system protein A